MNKAELQAESLRLQAERESYEPLFTVASKDSDRCLAQLLQAIEQDPNVPIQILNLAKAFKAKEQINFEVRAKLLENINRTKEVNTALFALD